MNSKAWNTKFKYENSENSIHGRLYTANNM